MENNMSEPISSAAGIYGIVKAIIASPVIIGSTLASVIVMIMTMPRTKKQQFIALLSTFVGSIYGGGFLIDWFHLADKLSHTNLGGIYLLAGVPIWIILRGFFAYTERDKDKSLVDFIKDIKSVWKE